MRHILEGLPRTLAPGPGLDLAWRLAAGPGLAARCSGVAWEQDGLAIEARDEEAARQLRSVAPELTRALNGLLGAGRVRQLHIEVAAPGKTMPPANVGAGPCAAAPRAPLTPASAWGPRDPHGDAGVAGATPKSLRGVGAPRGITITPACKHAGGADSHAGGTGIASGKAARPARAEPQKLAHLIGGGPGSGKTRLALELLREHTGAAHVNVDDLRATLPEYRRMQAEGDPEAVAKANPAARKLAEQALEAAMAAGRDLVYDDPMSGNLSQRVELVRRLRLAGYQVTVTGVDAPVEAARTRARLRASASPRPGDIGRPVIAELEEAHRASAANTWAMMQGAERARLMGNGGRGPTLAYERIGEEPGRVYDRDSYESFLAKAGCVGSAEPGRGSGAAGAGEGAPGDAGTTAEVPGPRGAAGAAAVGWGAVRGGMQPGSRRGQRGALGGSEMLAWPLPTRGALLPTLKLRETCGREDYGQG